ncbi:MAG: polysaccharide biosynthesis tyrosine autokinase [Planctomycetaceae bacterium]|nr:polysaccharide biosynthesis tyrosine autokinase [Planctomycetaceae bacterium]
MDKAIQPVMNMPHAIAVTRPQAMPAGPGAAALTPKEILGIVRRHLLMIFLFVFIGTALGGGSWFLLSRYMPKYTSIRPIDVDPPIDTDPLQIVGNQPQKDIYYQFRFTKASLLKQQNMLESLLQQQVIVDTEWFKKFAKIDANGQIIGDKDKAIKKALKDLKDNLQASAPRDQSYLLVSMTCGSPKEAQRIVDEAVRLFLQQQRDLSQSGLKGLLAQRTSQRDEIKSKIDQFERSLEAIRLGTPFARLNMGQGNQTFRDYMDQKLADIERRYSDFESEKGRIQSYIAIYTARVNAPDYDEYVKEQIENDPVSRQMVSNIAAVEPLLNRQLARFGEDHPLVKQTQAALDQMAEALVKRKIEIGDILRRSDLQTMQEQLAAMTQQLDTVTQQLQAARAEYKEVDRVRNQYAIFEKQRDEQQAMLQQMNTLIEKITAQHDDPKISKLSSPYSATVPRETSFPKLLMFVPGGFMLGLLAGLGLAFLLELSNDLLRTPSEVMRHVRAPLMGSICHQDDDDEIDGVDLYHVVRQAPYSIMSEGYRQLRLNLKLLGPESNLHKTLLVTSGQAGDGKTTVAVNMASTLLAENRRVLLIDANFRRPSTARLFPRSQADGTPAEFADHGLSNYLMGQCDAEQVIRASGIENLMIIDSGPLPANPAELLNSEQMKTLLQSCRQQFEYVIIDGPAALVSDSKTLATQTDGTIVVFNAQNTHRGAAIRLLRELKDINANVIGSVLMGVKSRKGGYFQEVYRSYQEYQRVHVQQPV